MYFFCYLILIILILPSFLGGFCCSSLEPSLTEWKQRQEENTCSSLQNIEDAKSPSLLIFFYPLYKFSSSLECGSITVYFILGEVSKLKRGATYSKRGINIAKD
jgi:hypothetical protein